MVAHMTAFDVPDCNASARMVFAKQGVGRYIIIELLEFHCCTLVHQWIDSQGKAGDDLEHRQIEGRNFVMLATKSMNRLIELVDSAAISLNLKHKEKSLQGHCTRKQCDRLQYTSTKMANQRSPFFTERTPGAYNKCDAISPMESFQLSESREECPEWMLLGSEGYEVENYVVVESSDESEDEELESEDESSSSDEAHEVVDQVRGSQQVRGRVQRRPSERDRMLQQVLSVVQQMQSFMHTKFTKHEQAMKRMSKEISDLKLQSTNPHGGTTNPSPTQTTTFDVPTGQQEDPTGGLPVFGDNIAIDQQDASPNAMNISFYDVFDVT